MSDLPLGSINFCDESFYKNFYIDGYCGYTDDNYTLTATNSTYYFFIKNDTNGIEIITIRGWTNYNNTYTIGPNYYIFKTNTTSNGIDRLRTSNGPAGLINSLPFNQQVMGTQSCPGYKCTIYFPYSDYATGSKTYQDNFFNTFEKITPTLTELVKNI